MPKGPNWIGRAVAVTSGGLAVLGVVPTSLLLMWGAPFSFEATTTKLPERQNLTEANAIFWTGAGVGSAVTVAALATTAGVSWWLSSPDE